MGSQYDGPPHAHPPGSALQSPIREHHSLSNGRPAENYHAESRPQSKDVSLLDSTPEEHINQLSQKPDRASNPMSFASILGPSNNEPAPKPVETRLPRPPTPPPKPVTETENLLEDSSVIKQQEADTPKQLTNGDMPEQTKTDMVQIVTRYVAPAKPRKILTELEADKILKALNQMEEGPQSDVEGEGAGFYEQKERYKQRSRKRAAEISETELRKRKVSEAHCRAMFMCH